MNEQKFISGDIVETIIGDMFYPIGTRAKFIGYSEDNNKKCYIRYEGEKYIGADVDVIPICFIRKVDK